MGVDEQNYLIGVEWLIFARPVLVTILGHDKISG
jgi:hypothetical protein